jgi:hypothetical protein
MEFVFKMKVVDLGLFLFKEDVVETSEGMRACQQYGKAVSEKMGA